MDKLINELFEKKWFFWLCFGLIIVGGFALRLTLIEFPLWYDEGCSIATAMHSFPHGINNYLWTHDLQHTPFYFYILHYIMQWFGDGVIILRASSLLVSMALLPVTYIVTEKLSSKKVALFAMLLMSVNTFQVLYSIEIRMYPYVILLALLSVNYLIDYDRKGDKVSLIKLAIVNILNPYFLTGSIVWVIAQFIIYSSYLDMKKADSKKISNYIISNLIMFLFFIPYIVLIVHYAMVRSTFLVTDLSEFSLINFWGMFQNLVSCDPGHIHETRFEPFAKNPNTLFLIFLPIAIMFLGLFKTLQDKEALNKVILSIVALCFGIFVILANSKTIAFTGRYLIFLSPFIFILTAIGLSKLNKHIVIFIILLYSIGCCYGFYSKYKYYKDIAEYSLKSPADFCKNNYPGKTNLVIMPFASSVSFYYFKGDDMPKVMSLELFHEVRNPENTNIYNEEQIEGFKNGKKYEVFQKMITSDTFISKNLVNYLNSYIQQVPKGGYIIWVMYYSDNYALKPIQEVKRIYGNIENVKNYTMSGVLSKFDLDVIALLSTQAKFIRKEKDLSNSFFVFQKGGN